MFKRKIDIFLDEWRNREHSPLIVKGMRQRGKTTSISEFGKNTKVLFILILPPILYIKIFLNMVMSLI